MATTAAKGIKSVESTDSGVRRLQKAKPRPRSRPRQQRQLSITAQVREALKPQNRLAAVTGFLLGGFVPLATYVVAHRELDDTRSLLLQYGTFLVAGGLAYSAKTVYDWGKQAFGMRIKAFGFVVLVEGVMIVSTTNWLALVALTYLVVINGIATGCKVSQAKGPLG